MTKSGNQIREDFLHYFQLHGHRIVKSASLVPEDDPTLLFTGAGMNQFKDYFLGRRKDLKQAASCQKCFRTPDLEQVGKTASHLTFFEMLGNFSFGAYFKDKAISFAWEFLTGTAAGLALPRTDLWVTVYEKDDEAYKIWQDDIGVPAERIVKLGAKDNFWPSSAPTDGPNGPCGPCSELHYDYGSPTPGLTCRDPKRCQPGCPCGRFVEVWNLVFTQFDRQSDGSLPPLPAKNIDTGMGLERLTAVVNGLRTNFETDLLKPIVDAVLAETKAKTVSPDVKAIADHVRALTVLIADGVVPSNDGRGYVARMLLRKAARHGRGLGVQEPFLVRLVPAAVSTLASGYPELAAQRERIAKAVLVEEERYQQTLVEKQPILEGELRKGLTAERAAWLYDTHGLPYEEIEAAAQAARAAMPSKAQFDEALTALQAKSKAAGGFSGAVFAETLTGQIAALGLATAFVGDTALEAKSKIAAILQDGRPVEQLSAPATEGSPHGTSALIVLEGTPFYGESGGQLGDQGTLAAAEGRLVVEDTKRVDATIIHVARLVEGRVKVHDPVTAVVDPARRRQVTRNHTATHLLHAALRAIVGHQVHQAGSLVAPDRLRFDFTSSEAVPAPRLRAVEQQVNAWVLDNVAVQVHHDVPMAKAKELGALMFFGDKYGDRVRVVTISEFSKELCGGTHLKATGEVGVLTIVDEGSVASGVRRIEALTGEAAWAHLKGAEGQLLALAQQLKAPREQVGDAVERLRGQIRQLQQELVRLKPLELRDKEQEARQWIRVENNLEVIKGELSGVDKDQLRTLAEKLSKQSKAPLATMLYASLDGGTFIVASGSGDAVEQGFSSGDFMKQLHPVIDCKGGGRADFAQGWSPRSPAEVAKIDFNVERLPSGKLKVTVVRKP